MKTKSLWLVIGFVLLLGTTVIMTDRQAAAGAQDVDRFAFLPFLSTPAGPPELELVPYVTGFGGDTITGIVNAGDERLFVAERDGRIRIVHADGTLQTEPFLNISDMVTDENWEEGLLGVAFHPNYPAVPYFFVTYTAGVDIRVSRFTVEPGNPNEADEKSELNLMSIYKKGEKKGGDYRVHNAGDLHFGPDGALYIAIGDGGPDPWNINLEGDPDHRGQEKDELLANILRIDVDVDGSGLAPDCGTAGYEIPADNPFVDDADGACAEIWSTGLRNPYRFSFDRQTGEMYIGEVGESRREEINYQPAGSSGGQNYGWSCYEGTVDYMIVDKYLCPPDTVFTMPIYEYDQTNHDCSAIGGYVYRGQQYPSLFGRYVFGDFCTGRMWLLNRSSAQSWTKSDAGASRLFIATFGEDIHGELYVGERSKGGRPTIYKVKVAQ